MSGDRSAMHPPRPPRPLRPLRPLRTRAAGVVVAVGWIGLSVGTVLLASAMTCLGPVFGWGILAIPIHVVLGLSLIGGGAFVVARATQWRVRPYPEGACQGCGFPRVATGAHRTCPECGWDVMGGISE